MQNSFKLDIFNFFYFLELNKKMMQNKTKIY